MADIVSAFPTSIAMSDSGVQRVAEAYVYAASDTSLTTPLAITDMQGIPITGGKLTTTSGQFPQFKAPAGVTQVLVLSGGRVTLLTDVSVYVGAAVESATAAATSAGAAEQARVLSAAAKTLAEQAAAAATAVGNTNDTIIEGRIKDSTSKTAVALKSTIGAEAAAAANGTANDSPAVQAFINAAADRGDLRLRSISPTGARTPNYTIGSTLDVPFTRSLQGEGRGTVLRAPANASLTNGFMIRANATADGAWPTPYPGFPATRIGNFTLDGKDLSGAKGILFGGAHRIEEIYAQYMDQVVAQINEYCDRVLIYRVDIWDKPDTNVWAIDLGGTASSAAGDALRVEQVAVNMPPAATYRPKLLRLRNRRGATITNIINGDILIEDSAAVAMSALHMEYGQIEFRNASGSLRDSQFFMRSDASGRKVTPVVISQRSGESGFNGVSVLLSGILFSYLNTAPLEAPTDGTPNFLITVPSTTARVSVSVRKVYRESGRRNDPFGHHMLYGATCGHVDFDGYSHLASESSDYLNGAWKIEGALPEIGASTGIQGGGVVADAGRVWSQPTGAYRYKVVGLLDAKRRIGVIGSSEQSVTLTNGGDGAAIILANEMRRPLMVEIYRAGPSTPAGQYDAKVTVPLVAGARFLDGGVDVGGFPWVAYSGAETPVNQYLTRLEIRPGLGAGTASDAYGRARVTSLSSNVAPTAGSWRKGDIVESDSRLGWVRATDCTTAAPTHVVGTDWIPFALGNRRTSTSPNSVITGSPGDIVARTDGSGESAVYVKVTGFDSNTGWRPVALVPPSNSTADFVNAANALNTTGKSEGKQAWNNTTKRPLWASGSSATSPWVDATGATVHTPS